ncbi:MAG: hypothetical protein CMP10_07005, partial [Zetaproteobacteria bacterium]|nr:hypothetical protein [Pseudobdellovibrionaceae bacterium]
MTRNTKEEKDKPYSDRQKPARHRRYGNRPAKKKTKAHVITKRGDVSHLEASLETGRYVCFDIETTGGNPVHNGITEIFAVRYINGKKEGTFYSMVNPKVAIPPIVRRMTGITNKMVKDAPEIDQVMSGFYEFIGDDVLVSHNTIGDMKFLRHFSQQVVGESISNYYLCTHLLTEKLAAEAPDKSLKGLSEHFNLPGDANFHRAEADAFLTLELFKVLLGRLQNKKIKNIKEAIRFQGDYESSVRLGWGISKQDLENLPDKPGVFYLYDHGDKVLFLSSAYSIQKEVRKLQNYQTLPKQLLKSVLASSRISFVESETLFEAALKEGGDLKDNPVRFDPANWHQRTANFLYLIKDNLNCRLTTGPLMDGASLVRGPIR